MTNTTKVLSETTVCNFLNVTGTFIGTYCGNPGVVVDGKKIRCEQCRDRRWPEETYTCTRVLTKGPKQGQPCGKNTKFSDGFCSVCRKIKGVTKVITERKIESVDDNEAQKRRVADFMVSFNKSIDAANEYGKKIHARYRDEPTHFSKIVEQPTILTKALDQQQSLKTCCFTYDKCIQLCKHNSQATSTSFPIFDEIIYDVGINWCWFYVIYGQTVASFRLHLEDDACWKFFKSVDTYNLHPSIASGTTFKYGSTTRKQIPKMGNTVDMPLDFWWLKDHDDVEFREIIEEEEFVDLYQVEENKLDYDMQTELNRLTTLRRQLVLGEC